MQVDKEDIREIVSEELKIATCACMCCKYCEIRTSRLVTEVFRESMALNDR